MPKPKEGSVWDVGPALGRADAVPVVLTDDEAPFRSEDYPVPYDVGLLQPIVEPGETASS